MAALLLPQTARSWPTSVFATGSVLCVLLALLLPLQGLVTTVALAVLWVLATLHVAAPVSARVASRPDTVRPWRPRR